MKVDITKNPVTKGVKVSRTVNEDMSKKDNDFEVNSKKKGASDDVHLQVLDG